MTMRYRLVAWMLCLGAMCSTLSVPGCVAMREIADRLMGNHQTHDVRIDLNPIRDWVDERLDDAEDAANDGLSRERIDAAR